MEQECKPSFLKRCRAIIIGKARDPYESGIFHKLSLIAFFAWVGLGADGLSSSCYGPEEAFLALGKHSFLGLFVAFATVVTIFIVSRSYSQIIELFPSGGGGYLVASKLLSPAFGMVSGCALLIDYVMTITISIASGIDAIFSFLPSQWHWLKLDCSIFGVVLLTIMNLRGVKESVLPLVPIFLTFIVTHVFAIGYALLTHAEAYPVIVQGVQNDIGLLNAQMGIWGIIFLVLHAYSMGAGTFTGIEAVSNGLPILREPKVKTAKRTMNYMAFSLSFMVLGLMIAYVLYSVSREGGKTLNAIVLERITAGWGESGTYFVLVTLVSEAVLLFVAAQTGFLDGPRVLANMAMDRWVPVRFAMLSDRLVSQNGILIMGGAAFIMMVLTRGSVALLVVLYSINVFITFSLSQLGMVRHWWKERGQTDRWRRGLVINGVGFVMTSFILGAVTILKFHEGGWVTLLITGCLVSLVLIIRRHYNGTIRLLRRLDSLVEATKTIGPSSLSAPMNLSPQSPAFDPRAKTAVILVNGFNGLGLHTLFNLLRTYGNFFKNFIFLEVGVIDAGIFKGSEALACLSDQVKGDLDQYVELVKRRGFYGEGMCAIGVDVIEEVIKSTPQIMEKFPNTIFVGGQLVFPEDTILSRLLHNYTAFALQRRLYHQGIPFMLLPIRVY